MKIMTVTTPMNVSDLQEVLGDDNVFKPEAILEVSKISEIVFPEFHYPVQCAKTAADYNKMGRKFIAIPYSGSSITEQLKAHPEFFMNVELEKIAGKAWAEHKYPPRWYLFDGKPYLFNEGYQNRKFHSKRMQLIPFPVFTEIVLHLSLLKGVEFSEDYSYLSDIQNSDKEFMAAGHYCHEHGIYIAGIKPEDIRAHVELAHCYYLETKII